ncbi:hypothetical protein [Arthrobacter woluwensis]
MPEGGGRGESVRKYDAQAEKTLADAAAEFLASQKNPGMTVGELV